MSDEVPPNQPNTPTDSDLSGGWAAPKTPGAWRAAEKPAEPEGWKVSVLPEDMTTEAEESGAWHLPKPDDTTFSDDDEIEITEERRPEDQLLEIAALASNELIPVAETAEPEGPLAPEDLIYLIEHPEEDEESDNLQMSELMALASLVENEEPPADDDSSITAVILEDDDEDDTAADEGLSAAERLILNSKPAANAPTTQDDPASYAAQQLAQLGLDNDPLGTAQISDDTLGGSPVDAGDDDDPASYAAQQLAQLGLDGDATGIGQPTGPAAPVAEPEDPRQVELGRKFRDTQEQVALLRLQVQNGQLSQDDYLNQLRDLMVLDDERNWWMLGVETDQWYKSENNAWVEAYPEPLAALDRHEQAQQQGGMGGFGGGSTQYNINDSLPRINEQPVSPEEQSEGSSGIRLDENFMPIPEPATVEDFDATVPGRAAYADSLGYDDQTVAGNQYYEATVPAEPVDYNTIGTADAGYGNDAGYGSFDTGPDQAPAYDLDRQGEVYQEAVDTQQQRRSMGIGIAAAALVVVLLLGGAGFVFLSNNWYNSTSTNYENQIAGLLTSGRVPLQTVTILDRNGTEIASIAPEGDDRRPLDSLNEISPEVIHAFLTLEDPTFFDDVSWNFSTTLNEFFASISGGNVTNPAGPITRQLVNELALGTDTPPAEDAAIVASEVLGTYSKDDLLLLYLNDVVFFGNQTYGIEAAAQFYFGESANELDLAEAAFLAAIAQNPLNNEPINNRETALSLMRVTMERMADVGCMQITASGQEFCVTQAMADPLQDAVVPIAQVEARNFFPRGLDGIGDYPHFTLLVRDILEAEYGNDIYVGGYSVTTTLDSELQDEAERLLRERVRTLNGVNTGSVLVTDPGDGQLLALIGSPDFFDEDVNGAVDNTRAFLRPGGTILPVIYAAALQGVDLNANEALNFGEYYTPASILWDVPIAYQVGNDVFSPTNVDGQFRGDVPVRDALQMSLNVPAVEAYRFIGESAFRQTAERMGLRFLGLEEEGATLGLGTALGESQVRLLDLVEAYGTIANDGQFVGLQAILSITDANGNSIPLPARAEPDQVLDRSVAYLMQTILSDHASRTQPGSPFAGNTQLTISNTQESVAAKSGTVRGPSGRGVSELWTMGFTNDYVVGVWLGTFDDSVIQENYTGAVQSATLWNAVLRAAVGGGLSRFQPPDNGTISPTQICPLTGAVGGTCAQPQRNERIASGRPAPDANIPGQGIVTQALVDSWTSLLANENCPQNQITAIFANITNTAAIEWINTTQAGAQYAQSVGLSRPVQSIPTQACSLSTTIPTVNITNPVPNEVVQGNAYAIIGQVAADGFARYEFQIAPAGTDNFTPLTGTSAVTQQQPNPGSTLVTWDTTQTASGNYTLRLAVFAQDGGFLYRDAPIQINNPEPTPTPIPTAVPTSIPTVPVPVDPIPFDPIPGDTGGNPPPAQFPTDIPADAQSAPPTAVPNPLG